MALIEKIVGLVNSVLQFGINGAKLKALSGAFHARNSADSAFAKIESADSTVGDDAVNLNSFNVGSVSVVSGVTKNVPADFSTIQLAVNFFKNKLLGSNNEITVDAGTYNEVIDVSHILGKLTIKGDARDIAGQTYTDGLSIETDSANGGSGTCTLTSALFTITVVGSGTSPDFATAGVVPGDTVYILDNNGSPSILTVASVLANAITLTAAAPFVGSGIGTSIIIRPNREIANANTILNSDNANTTISLKGFRLSTSTANTPAIIARRGKFNAQNIYLSAIDTAINSTQIGEIEFSGKHCSATNGKFLAQYSSSIKADYFVHFDPTDVFSFRSEYGGKISVENARAIGGTTIGQYDAIYGGSIQATDSFYIGMGNGYNAKYGGSIDADSADGYVFGLVFPFAGDLFFAWWMGEISASAAVAKNGLAGYRARELGNVYAVGAVAQFCTTGYHSEYIGYINATSTSINNLGNTTNYSPSVSDTPGNILAVNTIS